MSSANKLNSDEKESPNNLKEIIQMCEGNREALLQSVHICEVSERYDDMCIMMKTLVDLESTKDEGLSGEERNLLSVAFKNKLGPKRTAWRTVCSIDDERVSLDLIEQYKVFLEKEIVEVCDNALAVVSTLLSHVGGTQSEEEIFYLKMIADYNRYKAEIQALDAVKQSCLDNYEKGHKIAKEKLGSAHPLLLGLVLNFSVCCYEILQKKEMAMQLAKDAFDGAINEIDKPGVDSKESTTILQLLRDNLELWKREAENEQQLDDD